MVACGLYGGQAFAGVVVLVHSKRRKSVILPAIFGLSAGCMSLSAQVMAQTAAAHGVPPGAGISIVVNSGATSQVSRSQVSRSQVSRSQVSQSSFDCSVYGAGYVVVQGTTRCVHIRGRMRVTEPDPGYRGANYLPYAATSGAALPAGLQANRPFGQIGR